MIDLNALVNTKQAASELSISDRRVRALLVKYNLGIKIAETWFLRPEDIAILRNRDKTVGRPSNLPRHAEVDQIIQDYLREQAITDREIAGMDNRQIYVLSRQIATATARLDSLGLESCTWADLIRTHLAKRRRILLGRLKTGTPPRQPGG